MLPHLLALNLNGMSAGGDKAGNKILPLGQGDLDVKLLKTIADSGYQGPIGVLGHTNDDAEERLKDNLDGLDWLIPQISGKPAGPKPKPRTTKAAASPKSFLPPPGTNLMPTDPTWWATLIDRSPDEAYLGVKVDGAGRVFVGGRESAFTALSTASKKPHAKGAQSAKTDKFRKLV